MELTRTRKTNLTCSSSLTRPPRWGMVTALRSNLSVMLCAGGSKIILKYAGKDATSVSFQLLGVLLTFVFYQTRIWSHSSTRCYYYEFTPGKTVSKISAFGLRLNDPVNGQSGTCWTRHCRRSEGDDHRRREGSPATRVCEAAARWNIELAWFWGDIFPILGFLADSNLKKAIARQVMSEKAWAYYSSASDDEITNRENHAAYQRFGRLAHCCCLFSYPCRIWFRPRVLRDVSKVDWSTTILGHRSSMPVYIVGPSAIVVKLCILNISRQRLPWVNSVTLMAN